MTRPLWRRLSRLWGSENRSGPGVTTTDEEYGGRKLQKRPPTFYLGSLPPPQGQNQDQGNKSRRAQDRLIVAVMGSRGAGKSSFVKLVTGRNDVQVGHGLGSSTDPSCSPSTRVTGANNPLVAVTSEVQAYDFEHDGKLLTIVDTPGFDDSAMSDRAILLRLLEWVKTELGASHKISGILYLHRIDAPRMQGSSLRNFSVFKQLCGDGFYKNVILGTTCWDLLDSVATGERREMELKGEGGFWHGILQKGSQLVRIPRDAESARQLVVSLAAKAAPATMKCQVELSQGGGRMEDVSAMKAANPELERLRKENEEARRSQREKLEREQEEIERRRRMEWDRKRRETEEQLRQQEAKRQRLLREQRESEARRETEMRELRDRMAREKREAEEKRKEEQAEAQWRLEKIRAQTELKAFMQAKSYGLTKVDLDWPSTKVKVCNHGFKLLGDEKYSGKSALFSGTPLVFR